MSEFVLEGNYSDGTPVRHQIFAPNQEVADATFRRLTSEAGQEPIENFSVRPATPEEKNLGHTEDLTPPRVAEPSQVGETLPKPQPEEVIPSASEITSPKGVLSPQVRPSVDEGAPLREQGQVAPTREGEPAQAQEAVAPEQQAAIVTPAQQAIARQAELAAPRPPKPPEPSPPVNDSQPHVSAIANRFTKERAAAGEIGEVAPGQGYSTRTLAEQGLQMGPEQVNQHISDLMQNKGDPIEQAKAVRAEEARYSERSKALSRASEARPGDMQAKGAADAAFNDLTDFHKGPVAKVKERFHALGMSLQGELEVDLSTYNGLREKYLQDTGKPPPPRAEPLLRKTAERVKNANGADAEARTKLGQEIDKATRGKKLRSAEEVRDSIRERMGLGPCKT